MQTTGNKEVLHIFCVLKARKTDSEAGDFVSSRKDRFMTAT